MYSGSFCRCTVLHAMKKKNTDISLQDTAPFSRPLLEWYAEFRRDLPWRNTADPYRIWISEIILQQTRVVQGLDYYLRFVGRFPDIRSLALAEEDEVMKYWQGLGYYSRARNLHAAAKCMLADYGGEFPRSYDGVRALKGIGDYTAAAIVSFAYGMPYAVVDGNVYRVLSRLFDIDTPIDTGAGKKLFAELAERLLDRNQPGLYNQALMELGALQCVPRSPRCELCPLSDKCLAYASGRVEQLPVKQGKTAVRPRYFHYFHIVCGGDTWIRRREGNDIWRNLYEFPLIETDEPMEWADLSETDAFGELFGRTSPVCFSGEPYRCKHVLSHRIIHAAFYRVEIEIPSPVLLAEYKRVSESELDDYAVARLTEIYLER